jgi:mannose-6-phosphate isomerase-like protein (cupin superfamily)
MRTMSEGQTAGAPVRKEYNNSDRVFVRGIQGEYNLTEELERLRARPRVVRGRDLEYFNGPHVYGKHYLEPKDGLGQTLHVHLQEYAPGATSQKHGHVNEAVFYILDGIGTEVHDGLRYDWDAGDIVIVHNNCVHQHFNRSTDRPARALVMKSKPMYLFMNMLFQRSIKKQSREIHPNAIGFVPREDHQYFPEADHDHEHAHVHAHPSTTLGASSGEEHRHG